MDLGFKFGNFLTVDGRFLQAGDIQLMRYALRDATEMITEKTAGNEMRIAVIRIQSGDTKIARRVFRKSKIFDPEDNFNPESSDISTLGKYDLQPRFRIYWETAEKFGYVPEIRLISGQDDGMNGAWLFARPQSPR